MRRFLGVLPALALLGCTTLEFDPPDLTSFAVTVDTTNLQADKGELLDVPTTPVTVTVDIQAIGREGQPLDWDGTARLKVRPGTIVGEDSVVIEGGVATDVPVQFVYAWGDARVWVEDRGEIDDPGTYAVGVSDALPFNLPTVADMQVPGDLLYVDAACFGPFGFLDDCAGLAGDFVRLRGMDHGRRLLVTAVATDGFYATDLDTPVGNYGSVFAFNFSRPTVEVGDLLRFLSGNVAEFIGFTELNYPVWDAHSSGHDLPEPTDIAAALEASGATSGSAVNQFLERYESSRVRIPDAVFAEDLFDEGTYLDFAQWPVRVPGSSVAEFTIISRYVAPQFDPLCWMENHAGESMGPVEAHLRHIGPAEPEWVLDLDSVESFSDSVRNSDCWNEAQRSLPPSGPRHAPQYYYRDLPTCSGLPWDHEDE